jgi:aspartyl/asparaginyl beta-hydroxylase (cupin superfamily)
VNAAVMDQAQLNALLDGAELAYARGQPAEASRLLASAQSAAPDNAAVLGACGVQALRNGDAAEAKLLLQRAIERDSRNPRLLLNLASALRALNAPEEELETLQKALAIDPYFSLAIFQKASLFERQGKRKLAARTYHAALASLRPGGTLPVSWQPIIEHAQEMVRGNYRELEHWLSARLHDVKQRYPDAPQDRADDCLAVFLGKKRIYVQQPLFMHFPRLPAIEFFERRDFPWLAQVEAATDNIREELVRLLQDSLDDFTPYLTHTPETPLNQWQELNQSRRWSALFLYKDGQRYESNIARCPITVAALENVPAVRIENRGPTSMFSRLEPRTRLPPHTGSTNTRLTVHIPLIVPPHCGFRVGSQVREWQPGTALIFDDTIEHEAWNDSDEPRVILIFDIWNPLLTEAEREIIRVATIGISEFYQDPDALPGGVA